MKKYLSLVLAFALILTTVVLPISASADEGTKAITITLSTDKNDYYGGDELTLTVKAKLNSESTESDTFTAVNFMVGYSSTYLTPVNENGLTITDSSNNTVDWSTGSTKAIGFVSTNLALSKEDTQLYTAKFTVNETYATDAKRIFALSTGTGYPVTFVNDNNTYGKDDVACDTVTLTFPEAEEKVTVTANGSETTLSTTSTQIFHSTDPISVKVAMEKGNLKSATLDKITTKSDDPSSDTVDTSFDQVNLADAENNTWTPESVNEGTYKVTVTTRSGSTSIYYFEWKNESVSAQIDLESPNDLDNGYKPNGTITIPVKITGLASATAAMVEFDVKYDSSILTLDTTSEQTNITFKDVTTEDYSKKILYGENGTGSLSNGAKVVDLKFTVNNEILTYGDTKVEINAIKWVEKMNEINAADSTLGAGTKEITAVVIPDDNNWGTVSGWKDAWTGSAYDVTVSNVPTGVTVKYFESEDKTDNYTTGGKDLTNNTFSVNNDKYHYMVVAAVGTSKTFTKELAYKAPGADGTYLDTTAPTLSLEDMTSWVSTVSESKDYTPDANKVADSGSGEVKFVFSTNSAEDTVFTNAAYTSASEKYTVNKEASLTKLYVIGIDKVGNTSTVSTVNVKYDGDLPTANATAGNLTNDGQKRTINITNMSDNTSGINKVELFKKAAEQNSESVKSWVEGTDLINGTLSQDVDAGTYYVVVTDNANNKYTTDDVVVTVDKVTAEAIKVATVKSAESTTKISDKGTVEAPFNLGTFTYIKLEATNEKGDAYDTTITLKRGETTLDGDDNVYVIDATAANSDNVCGTYTLTVTTTNRNDSVDTDTASYTFTITNDLTGMKSVENDAAFDAGDYYKMNKFTTDVNQTTKKPAFEGGIYSADVNGDLAITSEDTAAILKALQDVEYVGIYSFKIMNGMKQDSNLFDGLLD